MDEQLEYIKYFFNNEYIIIRTDNDEYNKIYPKIYNMYYEMERTKDPKAKEQIIKDLYSRMKIAEFKYGGEYDALKDIPEYKGLIETIDYLEQIEDVDLRIKKIEQIENAKYEIIRRVKQIDNTEVTTNADLQNDLLCSMNTMFRDNKDVLTDEELYKLFIEYHKLKNDEYYIDKAQRNIKDISKKVWQHALTDPKTFKNGEDFTFLVHNFPANESLIEHIVSSKKLRDKKTSCSLITDSYVGIYGSRRRCGFIYPYASNIVASGKRDLYTLEAEGKQVVKNREYDSTSLDPGFLEEAGKKQIEEDGEDFDFGSRHNEVLLDDAKPIAIYIMGYGEKDINCDYEEIQALAESMGLPIVEIDMTEYREKQGLDPLGEKGKDYIAEHVIRSYLGINLSYTTNDTQSHFFEKMYMLKEACKKEIAEAYIKLKKSNNLNKENMMMMVDEIIRQKQLEQHVDDMRNDISSKIRQ